MQPEDYLRVCSITTTTVKISGSGVLKAIRLLPSNPKRVYLSIAVVNLYGGTSSLTLTTQGSQTSLTLTTTGNQLTSTSTIANGTQNVGTVHTVNAYTTTAGNQSITINSNYTTTVPIFSWTVVVSHAASGFLQETGGPLPAAVTIAPGSPAMALSGTDTATVGSFSPTTLSTTTGSLSGMITNVPSYQVLDSGTITQLNSSSTTTYSYTGLPTIGTLQGESTTTTGIVGPVLSGLGHRLAFSLGFPKQLFADVNGPTAWWISTGYLADSFRELSWPIHGPLVCQELWYFPEQGLDQWSISAVEMEMLDAPCAGRNPGNPYPSMFNAGEPDYAQGLEPINFDDLNLMAIESE